MKWWKPKHSVCAQCGVHFEPVTGPDARWGHLCAAHRKAVKEQDLKRDAVIAWATVNWERLVQMMENETTSIWHKGNYEQKLFKQQRQEMQNYQNGMQPKWQTP